MRRLMTGLLLMLVAAALAGPAAAKEATVELGSTPAGLGPGDPWNLGIQVFADPGALANADPPVVTIRNSAGEETRFPAEPLGTEPGTYTATVVFPEAGTWTYEVYESAIGRTYEYDPVVIEAPAVASDRRRVRRLATGRSLHLGRRLPALAGSRRQLRARPRRRRPDCLPAPTPPARRSGALAEPSTC